MLDKDKGIRILQKVVEKFYIKELEIRSMTIITLESSMKCQSIMDAEKIYRYSLKREWDITLPKMVYIMLNPSTADHLKGDPTLNKCLNYAIDNGYGAIEIVNLFAYRSTDPNQLSKVEGPIGKENDRFIVNAVRTAETIVLAWGGEKGKFMNRAQVVTELIQEYKDKIKCFEDYTNKKKPQHPLTLKNGYILIDYYPLENKSYLDEMNASFKDEWETLNYIELNRYAKEVTIDKLLQHGLEICNKHNDLYITKTNGNEIRIHVKSIRSTTNYVQLLKNRFNIEQSNLFLLLTIFKRGKQPQFYLIPASAFKTPNSLFRDRSHYEVPEYGMNVSERNMSLLKVYQLEEMILKLF